MASYISFGLTRVENFLSLPFAALPFASTLKGNQTMIASKLVLGEI